MESLKISSYFLILSIFLLKVEAQNFQYPYTHKDIVIDDYFGNKIHDSYQWLENTSDSSVTNWVETQNEFTRSQIDGKSIKIIGNLILDKNDYYLERGLSTKLSNENQLSLRWPSLYDYKSKDLKYATPCLYIKKNQFSNWEILIDPLDYKLKQSDRIIISNYTLSPNKNMIAFSISRNGSDWNEIRIRNIEENKDLPEVLHWIKASNHVWLENGFYYRSFTEPAKNKTFTEKTTNYVLRFHEIGESQLQDKEVEGGPYDDMQIIRKKYVFFWKKIRKKKLSFNVVAFKNIMDSLSTPKIFLTYPDKIRYSVEILKVIKDTVVIKTNLGADKEFVAKYSLNQVNSYRQFIPEKEDLLYNVFYVGKDLMAIYTKNMSFYMIKYDSNGVEKNKHEFSPMSLPEIIVDKNHKESMYIEYSLEKPEVKYDFDFETFQFKLQRKILVNYFIHDFEIVLHNFTTSEGIQLSMLLFHKKGLKWNGSNPTILQAYGGYNHFFFPQFNPANIFWVEHGGVLATVFVRGGGEKGLNWYINGTRLKTQNAINDFNQAAEYLITQKITSPNNLIATGASHGGFLVTASCIQRPDLYKICIPEVGVFDMLRYQKFTIGNFLTDQYGSSEDSIDFQNLFKLSPLHNVKEGVKYPSFLIMTREFDDRAPPLHSYKFTAKLQELSGEDNPTLLLCQKNEGHNGGETTEDFISNEAYKYAFIFKVLKKKY